MHWTVIVNPYAGSGKTLKKWEEAESLLSGRGVSFITVMPGGGLNVRALALRAASAGKRRFIAVGGDGTAHDVLAGIMAYVETGKASISEFYLAVIPIGSGNDWLRTHNIPRKLDKVCELICAESFVRQDVVKVECWNGKSMSELPVSTSYMLNIGGAAFDARVCARVNSQKREGKRGKVLYFAAVIYILFKSGFFDITLKEDGKTVFDGLMYSTAFGTGRFSGGGMRQTPDAIIDDGLIDMTLFPSKLIPRKVYKLFSLFTGRINKIKDVVTGRASEYDLIPKPDTPPVKIEVDGEVVGTAPLRMTVLKDQIMVLHNSGI